MKILHTADLHLGRQFFGLSLEADHAEILDQIVSATAANDVDLLVVAGDVFDRAAPPESAVKQFNAFLRRVVAETDAAIVMIAGNHDSSGRIAAMSILSDPDRALIRGGAEAVERPLLLKDAFGEVAISALPFSYEYAAREAFEDEGISSPEDVLRAQVAAARAEVPEGARWVVVAHAFVDGGAGSEGERPLTRVGGIETVAASVFDGVDYVALGHLHRPQQVGAAHIRYSGSPLAFGFDEAGAQKSMLLLELNGQGVAAIEAIPFTVTRGVRELRGTLGELIAGEGSNDFIRAVLTDQTPLIEPMKRLREVFPNACQIVLAREERASEVKALGGQVSAMSPIEMVGSFLETVRGNGLDEGETTVIAAALHAVKTKEGAQ
ncbi:exonuclease SbcCD subunit D [Sinisalibacter aestuarii]|uniref:Nuclease SbcCD subunit D n=1 Tax=Sinisalibacter aestuarii TaxID=2949426 RepID=A0ABQ5LQW0_9RHOB|nr:exonuclease SbcCD subunit D [Sinisalibacter aestuarii]GKY87395.1 nuclease SbcCD subunit D [Sinisalibacter aestuarii]